MVRFATLTDYTKILQPFVIADDQDFQRWARWEVT